MKLALTPWVLLFTTFQWLCRCTTPTISSPDCNVTIQVYLNDTTGDTIIIEAVNTATGNIYSYPGFQVLLFNPDHNASNGTVFGRSTVDYYGIGSYVQLFTVTSNTSMIQRGEIFGISIELWTGFFNDKQCSYQWIGPLTVRDAPIFTQAMCPVTVEDISALVEPNTARHSLLIDARYASKNSFDDGIRYPGWRVYIVENDGNMTLFGEHEVYSAQMGDGTETFEIDSFLNMSFEVGQQYTLYIELWTYYYQSLSCVFEWDDWEWEPVMTTTTSSTSISSTTSFSSTTSTATSSSSVTMDESKGFSFGSGMRSHEILELLFNVTKFCKHFLICF